MRSWSLQLQFALYSALLTVLALAAGAAALLWVVKYRQIDELDEQLAQDARDLAEALPPDAAAPAARRPFSPKVVPVTLRLRYIQIDDADGLIRYKSGNLGSVNLKDLPPGTGTVTIADKSGRICTVRSGSRLIHIGTTMGRIVKMQDDLTFGLLWSVPVVGLVVFVGGWLLGKRAVRPVASLTTAAEKISVEQPEERLPVPPGQNEIARLTEVLNRSFNRLQRAYETAARFSADASHQLKTPVAVLRAGLESLRRCDYLQAAELEEVGDLLHQTRRLTALIEDLLLLAQADAGRLKLEPTTIDIIPLIGAAIDDLEVMTAEKGVAIDRNLPESLTTQADRRRLAVILQNLVENAAKYTPEGGSIRLAAGPAPTGGGCQISVANTGPAIPPEHQERIFERFHRGDIGENVRGHGLGLNIARELARAHGGDLFLQRSDGAWTEFILTLPAGI